MTLGPSEPGRADAHGIDGQRPMPTASVIKLRILVVLYRAAAAGRLSFDDRVRVGAQHDVFGSGVLHQLTYGVEMSLCDAATLMIIISDNVATNMCLEALGGFGNVNETMRAVGLEPTMMFMRLGDTRRGLGGRNHYVTRADEIARLLAMLARREVVPRMHPTRLCASSADSRRATSCRASCPGTN
jgi:beta-lactamase class A